MFCTPPATTRSAVPDITAWAAKCTACCDEPHWRSTVVPGTSSEYPATSQHVRAMSPACGPIVSTQPNTTSSTAAGSTSTRSNSARIEWAPRSAGCTCARPPLRLPTGERTASTMYASLMGRRLEDGRADPVPVEASVAHAASERPRPLHVEVQVVFGGVADRAVALQRDAWPSSARSPSALAFAIARVRGIERDRRPVDERPRELERDARVRQMMLHRLERPDRNAELVAFLRVVGGHRRACDRESPHCCAAVPKTLRT